MKEPKQKNLQVKFGLEKFQKETYLSLMIIFHFSCIIISDVSLAFHVSYIATYVVQDVFLLWGLILYVTFLYAGYKVKALLRTLPPNLLTRDNSASNQKGRWICIHIERSGNNSFHVE